MRKITKNEQIKAKKQPKRPKRPLMIEPNFASYLTGKEFRKDQLYVNKKRTIKYIQDDFKTVAYLNESKLLDQEYKNELFSSSMIDSFLNTFQFYDSDNTEDEEQNKLHIAIDGIQRGIHYFQNRYPESSLAYKQAEQIQEFLGMLSQVTQRKSEDRKAIEFYKTRHSMLLPPTISQSERLYVVMCRICWGHYSDKEKDKAISKVRHGKRCPYDKNQKKRCFEIIPPKITS